MPQQRHLRTGKLPSPRTTGIIAHGRASHKSYWRSEVQIYLSGYVVSICPPIPDCRPAESCSVNVEEIARTLQLFIRPDEVGEVRVIYGGNRRGAVSIYFLGAEGDETASRVAEMGMNAKGVYVVMNSVPPEFIERSPRNCNGRETTSNATRDRDIVCRQRLLIDFDPHSPERGADDSATDEEKAAAHARMESVREYLSEMGLPDPVIADSGNGWHLLYRIDLPNDDDAKDLVREVLGALSERFSDEAVDIDTSVYNASRLTKIYGTRARKGEDRPERPHRISHLISVPEVLAPVTRELLQQIIDANQLPATPVSPCDGARVPVTPIVRRRRGAVQDSSERLQVPEIIPSGHRHNALVSIAGSTRSWGASEAVIRATLMAVVECQMEGEFPEEETREIARWAAQQDANEVLDARVRGRPDVEIEEAELQQRLRLGIEQLQRRLVDPNGNSNEVFVSLQRLLDLQPTSSSQPLETITSAELANAQYNLEYLIPGLLVKGQPCVMAGPKKCLKTNTLIDLTLSIATGTGFLGHFSVPIAHRVALLSGESGAATIQETARRVARSKNDSHLKNATNAFWCFDLPKLGQPNTVRALVDYVNRHDLDVICIDPAYLCMPIGDSASNLFVVGPMLADLSKVASETGVTIVLAHHTTKTSSSKAHGVEQFAPPELENIAWAGFQEWARQWMLLGRSERYDPDRTGHHKLWLAGGGSAGHSGLWGVTIDEGSQQDLHGRRWHVRVASASAVCTEQQTVRSTARDNAKRAKEQARRDERQIKAILAYRLFPDGETKTQLRDAAGLSGTHFETINAQLIQQGLVEECNVEKNGKSLPGFRLRATTGTTRTDPD